MRWNDAVMAKKVADACRISQKPNPGLALARKRFGSAVDRLVKKRVFSASPAEQKLVKELRKLRYGPLVYEYRGKLHA